MRIYQIVSYFFCILLIGRKSEYTFFFLFQDFNACFYSAILLISNVVEKKKKNKKKKGGSGWDWLEFSKSNNSTYNFWATKETEKARGFKRGRQK